MDYSHSLVNKVYFCFMTVKYEVLECLFSLQNSENAFGRAAAMIILAVFISQNAAKSIRESFVSFF